MTGLDLDEQLLVTRLHACVDDAHPDLARVALAATRAGTRIRRRRRATVGLAGAAGVGLVLGGVLLLPGLGGGSAAPETGFLAEPTGEPIPQVTRIQESAAPRGQDLAFTIDVPDGWACEDPADDKFGCHVTSTPIPRTAQVTVVQRPRSHWPQWSGSKADPSYLVSEPHQGWFVSLQPDPEATTTDLEVIADALTWNDGMPVF